MKGRRLRGMEREERDTKHVYIPSTEHYNIFKVSQKVRRKGRSFPMLEGSGSMLPQKYLSLC